MAETLYLGYMFLELPSLYIACPRSFWDRHCDRLPKEGVILQSWSCLSVLHMAPFWWVGPSSLVTTLANWTHHPQQIHTFFFLVPNSALPNYWTARVLHWSFPIALPCSAAWCWHRRWLDTPSLSSSTPAHLGFSHWLLPEGRSHSPTRAPIFWHSTLTASRGSFYLLGRVWLPFLPAR